MGFLESVNTGAIARMGCALCDRSTSFTDEKYGDPRNPDYRDLLVLTLGKSKAKLGKSTRHVCCQFCIQLKIRNLTDI